MPRSIEQGFSDFLTNIKATAAKTSATVSHRASIKACLENNFLHADRALQGMQGLLKKAMNKSISAAASEVKDKNEITFPQSGSPPWPIVFISERAHLFQKHQRRQDRHAPPRMQNQQIGVAADQHVRIARMNQCQKMIVFRVAAWRLNVGRIGLGHFEKQGAAADDGGKLRAYTGTQIPVELVALQHAFQLSQRRPRCTYLGGGQSVGQCPVRC